MCGWHGRSPVDHCSASEDSNRGDLQAFAALSAVVHSASSRAEPTQTIRDCSSAVVLSAQKVGLQNPTERISHQSQLKAPKLPQPVPPSTPNQQPPNAIQARHFALRAHSLSLSSSSLLSVCSHAPLSPSYASYDTAMRGDAMQEHGQGSGMTLSLANEISLFLTPKQDA